MFQSITTWVSAIVKRQAPTFFSGQSASNRSGETWNRIFCIEVQVREPHYRTIGVSFWPLSLGVLECHGEWTDSIYIYIHCVYIYIYIYTVYIYIYCIYIYIYTYLLSYMHTLLCYRQGHCVTERGESKCPGRNRRKERNPEFCGQTIRP